MNLNVFGLTAKQHGRPGPEMGLEFYAGRRVLVTGHTGFKGCWLSQVLLRVGADVWGYSLPREGGTALFEMLDLAGRMHSHHGDVRDLDGLRRVMDESQPEVIFHLAAQPLVIESYRDPAHTYGVNVMGTVNVLEAARCCPSVQSVVNVTTDKVYENREWEWTYREDDRLNGLDPYSNSKSCSELVTKSYANCLFGDGQIVVSTARAGNVIGGGDFANNRIVPDCVRAAIQGEPVRVRNPGSVRPYQHVLESLSAYLTIASAQATDCSVRGAYNVGPLDEDNLTTAELVEQFCTAWGEDLTWVAEPCDGPHEAKLLRLDSSRIRSRLGWQPRWSISEAIGKVVDWTKEWTAGVSLTTVTNRQIEAYFEMDPLT